MPTLNKAQFNRIKAYQRQGWSIEKTRRRCGNSWDTVKRVFLADTFDGHGTGTKHVKEVLPIPQKNGNHVNPAVAQVTRLRDEAQKRVDAYNLVLENLQ